MMPADSESMVPMRMRAGFSSRPQFAVRSRARAAVARWWVMRWCGSSGTSFNVTATAPPNSEACPVAATVLRVAALCSACTTRARIWAAAFFVKVMATISSGSSTTASSFR